MWFYSWLMQIYWPLNISLLGVSIHACKHSGHHLVTYKEDITLLDAILSPTPSSGGLHQHMLPWSTPTKHMSRGGEEKWIEYVNQPFLQNLLMLDIYSFRNAHLKSNIYSFILYIYIYKDFDMISPPRFMVLPPYVKCVIQIMTKSAMLIFHHRFKHSPRHPFIDDEADECINHHD